MARVLGRGVIETGDDPGGETAVVGHAPGDHDNGLVQIILRGGRRRNAATKRQGSGGPAARRSPRRMGGDVDRARSIAAGIARERGRLRRARASRQTLSSRRGASRGERETRACGRHSASELLCSTLTRECLPKLLTADARNGRCHPHKHRVSQCEFRHSWLLNTRAPWRAGLAPSSHTALLPPSGYTCLDG